MAFKHGSNAALLLGGADVSVYFKSLAFAADVDTAETTTLSRDWKTHIPGLAAAGLETEGLYDPTGITSTLEAVLGIAPGTVVTAGPSGLALGDRCRLISSSTTSYGESSPVGDAVMFSWAVEADGPVGLGRVIVPLTAITADANGSAFDYTAATTTGAIAHLHVTSVSASDSIVVTIEDSVNGSTGWATIGTFASKSAVGAERIVIAGTVKQFLRAVYDVTGVDVSITVAVAVART